MFFLSVLAILAKKERLENFQPLIYLGDLESFHFYQGVVSGSQSKLLGMVKADPPIGVGVVVHQMVMMAALLLAQLGRGDDGHSIHCIHTCLVESHRIEGGKEAHIGDNGQVILAVAVTVGGYFNDQIDVEMGSALANGQRILADLAVELVVGAAVIIADGIGGTDSDATTASYALLVINPGESIGDMRCIVGTDVHTIATADAFVLLDLRLSIAVHLHLSGTRATAHTHILQSTAKTSTFMALEVGEADQDIGIHQCTAYLGLFHVFTCNRNQHFIRTLQAVSDQDMTAGGVGHETVAVGALQMVEGMLAPTDIERIAISKKRTSSQLLDQLHHRSGVVGPEKGEVSRLPEVNLDCGELVLEVNGANASLLEQAFKLVQTGVSILAAKVCVKDFGSVQNWTSSVFICVFATRVRLPP